MHKNSKNLPTYMSVGVLAKSSGLHRAVVSRLIVQNELEVAALLWVGKGRAPQPLLKFTGNLATVSTPSKIV
jgi:hypothetical protein